MASASTSLVRGWLPSVTVLATQSNSRRLAAKAVIAAWVIWADHRWIKAFVNEALSRFGLLLGPTSVGRLWLSGSSGHQLRWPARQVCSVVFGGVRGTCVLSHVWHPGLRLRHSGRLCCGVHWPELKVTPRWCQWRVGRLPRVGVRWR